MSLWFPEPKPHNFIIAPSKWRGGTPSGDSKSGLGDAFARFDFSAANRLRLVLVVENWITSNALETIDAERRKRPKQIFEDETAEGDPTRTKLFVDNQIPSHCPFQSLRTP